MRLTKYVFFILSMTAIAATTLITIGLYDGGRIFYVIAVWLIALSLVTVVIVLVQGYQRIVSRLGTANERLAELRFLQERRYDQTRVRLDNLLEITAGLRSRSGESRTGIEQIADRSANPRQHSELADLNARFQRVERLIIGRLENEFYNSDIKSTQLEELVSSIESAIQSSSGHNG